MNNIDELLLEYSIRTYIVRRVDWNKLACYFRFGRDWKKIKFICRLKIFFNMAATYSKLFCCVQWVHICLQIKSPLKIRWYDSGEMYTVGHQGYHGGLSTEMFFKRYFIELKLSDLSIISFSDLSFRFCLTKYLLKWLYNHFCWSSDTKVFGVM